MVLTSRPCGPDLRAAREGGWKQDGGHPSEEPEEVGEDDRAL
jgi:hypothetical protein